jgi:hypothetical protein
VLDPRERRYDERIYKLQPHTSRERTAGAMNAQGINRPLSGQEVKDAIITKIRKGLEKDCFLAPHLAYGAFSMHFTLELQFRGYQAMSGRMSATRAA